eukprot:CAMPEP_0170538260 /NCGR_PEP_ID=MMETSP0209-20121228/103204_2 /TAXON_ID=665100 ORGANISM="Litonotus pictus, Strain P1" /NCGR_SAMPLE_ID=MMETSP0209 /ASSEMBLY_ACC=CAM_ASM_000301 /LENGTH=78 /DNA_ID=CAMNT_0010839915 /DNA_START=415 /DNA_END=651 /DNA_ORIENTATION=-
MVQMSIAATITHITPVDTSLKEAIAKRMIAAAMAVDKKAIKMIVISKNFPPRKARKDPMIKQAMKVITLLVRRKASKA